MRLVEEAPEVFGAWSDQVFGWAGPEGFHVVACLLVIFASAFSFSVKQLCSLPGWGLWPVAAVRGGDRVHLVLCVLSTKGY